MAGLVPAIHVLRLDGIEYVDARDKPGHDGGWLPAIFAVGRMDRA
jgi:hypothetical protein